MKRWWLGILALVTVCSVTPLGAAPAGVVELSPVRASRALCVVGETVELLVSMDNQSGSLLSALTASVELPEGWQAEPTRIEVPGLAPYTKQAMRFVITATEAGHGDGRIVVSGPGLPKSLVSAFPLVSCQPLPVLSAWRQLAQRSVGKIPDDDTLYVSTGAYVLFFPRCGDGYGPGLVYLRVGDEWRRMGTIPAMGRALYRDLKTVGGREAGPSEHWVYPSRYWIFPSVPKTGDVLVLKDQWQDNKGRYWTAKAYFAPTADPRVIKCTHMLWCTEAAALYRYEGPMASVGDGTFGHEHSGLQAPGDLPVPTPDPFLQRATPLAEGLMGVQSPLGGTLAMMWDTRQQWTTGRTFPQALIAAPNVLRHQDNTFMSLLVPAFEPGQRVSDALAAKPLDLPRGRFVYLRSELFVATQGLSEAHTAYAERFGDKGPGRALLPDPDVRTGKPDW